jgi:hypothetical protein
MKHESLLLDEQKCELLTQDEQNQIMSDLIEYLESLDPSDYSFHGENEYGFQMSISECRGYRFSIDLCWDSKNLWCYRNFGYVHPNLATVSGELRNALINRLGAIAMKWCGVKS